MLRVPNKAFGSFPSAATHIGGWHYDTGMNIMYWSDGFSWQPVSSTFGTVTEVGLTASGALDVSGSPITNSGTFNLYWTSSNSYLVQGDGSVVLKSSIIPNLIAGTGISITGTYPNLTISNTFTNPVGKFVAMNFSESDYVGNMGTFDANTITKTSEVYGNNISNTAYPYGYLKTIGVGNTFAWQLFKSIYSNVIYTRIMSGAGWGVWDGLGLWNPSGVSGQNYSATPQITTILSTDPGNAIGDVTIGDGGASWAGIINIRTPAKATVGIIGYYQDRMYYQTIVGGGYHHFDGDYLKINKPSSFGVINDILRLNMQSAGGSDGSRMSFRYLDSTILGWVQNYSQSGWTTEVYGRENVTLKTSPDYGVTPAIVLTGQSNGYVRIHSRATVSDTMMATFDANGVLTQRPLSGLPFTNNTGTVTNFSAGDLTTGYPNPVFTTSVSNPGSTPHLSFALPTLSQKLVLASPWGTSGTPFWRQLHPSDLQNSGANTGQAIVWDGSAWNPGTISGSKWTIYPQYIAPTSPQSIRTNTVGGQGAAQLWKGDATYSGSLEIYNTSGNRMGYVGQDTGTFMKYHVEIGNHRFSGGSVQLSTIPNAAAATQMLVSDSGVISYRDLSGLGFVPTSRTITINGVTQDLSANRTWTVTVSGIPVWKIQNSTTDATTIGQDIYHSGGLVVGDASGFTSSYKFQVMGDSYISSTLRQNNGSYHQWPRFTVPTTWLNGIRYDSSDRLELGHLAYSTIWAGYSSARSTDTWTSSDAALYVNASGEMKRRPIYELQNDAGEVVFSGSSGRTAGAAATILTFTSAKPVYNTFFTYDTTASNYKIRYGINNRTCFVHASIQFSAAGSGTVTLEFHPNATSGTIQFSRTFPFVSGINTAQISTLLSGNASDYQSIYVKCTGVNITISDGNLILLDQGRPLP